MPGRLEAVGERPLTLFDGAHNPSGAHALAASLPDVFGARRPRVAVVGVLEDKDAAGMLETLLPQLDRVVFTRPANPRSLSPATLAIARREARRAALGDGRDPRAALERARELAGPDGAVLATGSIYLIADLVREDAGRAGLDAVVALRVVRAVLFDLDGVLVESREATERVWLAWARTNGIGEEELRLGHARRAVGGGGAGAAARIRLRGRGGRYRAGAGGGHGGPARDSGAAAALLALREDSESRW